LNRYEVFATRGVTLAAPIPVTGGRTTAPRRRRTGRYVDEALVSARIVEAGGDKVLHAEMAHIAERHRRAGRVLGVHWRRNPSNRRNHRRQLVCRRAFISNASRQISCWLIFRGLDSLMKVHS